MLDRYGDLGAATVSDRCPNCGRDVALNKVETQMAWPAWTTNLAPPYTAYMTLVVWACFYCRKTTIARVVYPAGDEQFREPEAVEIIWPERPPRELPDEAPEAMRSLYREDAGALRGAAALYRAAVEELVGDRNAAGRDLYARIEALAAQGVDQDLVRDLHEARLLGNWSLHEGLEFSAAEVADVADLIQDAVEVLYVQPARRQAMREAREQRRLGGGAAAQE